MNKTVMITGATGGIGQAIARLFAQNKYNLILIGNKQKDILLSLCEELSQTGIICKGFCCDIGDFSAVEELFKKISDKNISDNIFSVDILINNAGISYIGLLQNMSPEEWSSVINTNLSSCFYTAKHTIPLMLSNGGGRIINISSVWGNVGASMEVAYSAAKGGMNSFTKALAKELAPSHIQVNAIACGVIDTPMNHCFSKEERQALQEEIPADRFGTPKEVAELVYQLATSPAYLTGQIITMDGGWY